MSKRGNVMVIKDGHYYGFYSHSLNGHMISRLLEEAADIAEEGAWDEIVEGWTSKTWLVESDNDRSTKAKESVVHPDGDVITNRWAYGMRPRLSRAETETEYGTKRASAIYGPYTDGAVAPSFGHPVIADASWRKAAELPVMLKEPLDALDRDCSIVLDADTDKIVWLDRTQNRIVAVCDTDDHAALRSLAQQSLQDHDYYLNNKVPAWYWRSDVASLSNEKELDWSWENEFQDGQWLRPAGFPALRGTPRGFPGLAHHTTAKERLAETKQHIAAKRAERMLDKALTTVPPAAPISHAAARKRCPHVGPRSKKQCIRPSHKGAKHLYINPYQWPKDDS